MAPGVARIIDKVRVVFVSFEFPCGENEWKKQREQVRREEMKEGYL